MISEQENQRLAEIEFELRRTDPRFVTRMARLAAPRTPWYRRLLRR
jgi:hypothetical protein